MCVQCCFLPLVYCYSVRRNGFFARLVVLRGSARWFFSTSTRLVHRHPVRQLFGTSLRTSCSVRSSQFSTSILQHVRATRPPSSDMSALQCVVSMTLCNMTLCGRRIARFAGGIPGRNESAVVTTVETTGVVTAGEELPPATETNFRAIAAGTEVTDGIVPAGSTVDLDGSRSESFVGIQTPVFFKKNGSLATRGAAGVLHENDG